MNKQLLLSLALMIGGSRSILAMEDRPADLTKPSEVKMLLEAVTIGVLKSTIHNATTLQSLEQTKELLDKVQRYLPSNGYSGNVHQQLTILVEGQKAKLQNLNTARPMKSRRRLNLDDQN
ncbi:MAG: hypothetical protein WCE21_00495 [Candidatus Babeliales bacterium]